MVDTRNVSRQINTPGSFLPGEKTTLSTPINHQWEHPVVWSLRLAREEGTQTLAIIWRLSSDCV